MKTNLKEWLGLLFCCLLLTSCGVDYTPPLDEMSNESEVQTLVNRLNDGRHMLKYDNLLVLVDDTDTMLQSYNGRKKRNIAYEYLDKIKLSLADVTVNRAVRIFSIHADRNDFKSQLLYGMTENFSNELKPAIVTRVIKQAMINPMVLAVDATNNELKIIPDRTAIIIISDFTRHGKDVEESVSILKKYYKNRVCIYPLVVSDQKTIIDAVENINMIDGCGFSVEAKEISDSIQLTDYLEDVLFTIAEPEKSVAPQNQPDTLINLKETANISKPVTKLQPQSELTYENLLIEKELVVHLTTNFNLDEAVIRDADEDQLQNVADFMNKYLDVKTTIEGHTCDLGTEDYNLQLSKQRAESIKRYLVENLGIDSSRLDTIGFGESRPVADNSTEEGRIKNRRAEAVISTIIMEKQETNN